jgi:YHS domain-containing protein
MHTNHERGRTVTEPTDLCVRIVKRGSKMKVTDPVCAMVFEEHKAAATFEYDGQTYHFCTEACRRQFEDDPGRYLPATAD